MQLLLTQQRLNAVLSTLVVLVLDSSAGAQAVTYVDAGVLSNTTLADGAPLVDGSIGYNSSSTAADDLWNLRATFSNDGDAMEGGNGEDAPRLRTTMSGLTVGESHEVFAYFWGAEGSGWRGRASLTDDADALPGYNTKHFSTSVFSPMSYVTANATGSSLNPGPLTTSNGGDPAFENGGYFSNTVMTEEGNRSLYEVSLGTALADSGGQIAVYIDDLPNTTGGNRTWYDGVGYRMIDLDLLTLEVNEASGAVAIRNDESIDFDIRYYEIQSDYGSLDNAEWDPLDSDPETAAIEGWQVAGGSDASVLSEVNLQSMLTVSSTDVVSLGAAFDPGAGADLAERKDLRFFYSAPGGARVEGRVTYVDVAPTLVGDYNGDHIVDAADYTLWRDSLGGDASVLLNRDSDNTGPVSQADYVSWRSNFGASAGAPTGQAHAAPEPSSALLGGAAAGLHWRRKAKPSKPPHATGSCP